MILSHILLHSPVQGIDLLGMILLMGGLTFRMLIVFPPPDRITPLERFLPFLLLLTGLSDLVLRSQMMGGRPLAQVSSVLPTILTKSHFGNVWIVRTFLLCFLIGTPVIKISKRFREGLALTAGSLLLLTISLSGHAADSGNLSLAVIVDWLHLLAASTWTGGLFFLAFVLRKWITSPSQNSTSPVLIASVKRFSTLAGACVLLILATGSYQVWHRVGNLAALLQTPYGKTLIVKLLLVILLLGLGAVNRYRILPKLSQQAIAQSAALVGAALKRLVNSVTLEIGLGLAIIACVSILMQLPPARGQWATTFKVSSHPESHLQQGKAHPTTLQPAEGAGVKIISPQEGQVIKGDEIPVHFKLAKGKRGEHVHAYVDGELMGMFESEKGTLTGIQPGHHTLELRVVAKDHVTELDASDRADFVTMK